MPPRRLGSRASRASSASAGLRAQSASRSTTSSASRRLSPSPSSSRAPSSRRASPSAGTRKAALAPGDRDVEYSVLLPVYNERENLPLVVAMLDRAFSSLPSPAPRWEVVVVEDASPDGTLAVAHALQAAFGDDRVVVLSRPGKMGLGTAYVDGLRLARGQFVFIMDADMSHHPESIPAFIAKQREGDYDVVTGTRYAAEAGGVYGWDFKRKLISRGANFLAASLLWPAVSDLTGSYRLYRRAVLEDIMPQVRSRGYVFQMEVIARVRYAGYSIGETPITFVDRVYGESKMGGSEIVQYLQGLANLFFNLGS